MSAGWETQDDNTKEFLAAVERKQEKFVETGGLIISAQMKRRAPVLTGNLRRSITSNVDRDSNGVYSDTGPGADYAEFVEYGANGRAAQPFAEPGFQAAQTKIQQIAEREFKT